MIWLDILTLLTWSILLHELGHFIYLRRVANNQIEIRFWYVSLFNFGFKIGFPADYYKLSKLQKYKLYIAGIFAGLIPIIVITFINVFYGIMIPLYFIGCKKDIRNIWRLIKHGDQNKVQVINTDHTDQEDKEKPISESASLFQISKQSFLNFKLFNPKPKPLTVKQEMEEVYQGKYDEIYKEERKKYLKQKAEKDAKEAAIKEKPDFIKYIGNLLTGGRF